MWNLKYDTNDLVYEIEQTLRHSEQTCGCQGGGAVGDGVGPGISRCKRLCLQWTSPGSHVQYLLITYKGKEYEKEPT